MIKERRVTTIVHKDMLGREVEPGTIIAYTQYNCLYIGTVQKLTAKRVHVNRLGNHNWGSQQIPGTFIRIDDPAVTAWMLKGAKTKWDILYNRD